MTALHNWLEARLPLEDRVRAHAVEEARRLGAQLGLDDPAMADRLARRPEELDRILELVVPPESWLFRHAPAFEVLRNWMSTRTGRRLRLASLGCARGPEAFSLAATAASLGRSASDTRIVAVDWNARHLAEARTGRCSPLSQRGPMPAYARHALQPHAQGWLQLRPEPLAMIEWMQADILNDVLPGPFDAVFCRNVAIYLSPEARRTLASRLRTVTAEDGLLFLGHADPAALWEDHFTPVGVSGAFGFTRPSAAPSRESTPGVRVTPMRSAPPASSAQPTETTPATDAWSDPFAQAQALADVGSLDEAESRLRPLLQRDPMRFDAWSLLGVVLLARARPFEAEECFRKAVYLRPEPLTLLQLAELASVRGDATAAERFRARAARCADEEAA